MVAKAGCSRFCYCHSRYGGQVDGQSWQSQTTNSVRYCQVRNVIAAYSRGWRVVGDEDGLSRLYYASVGPNKWVHGPTTIAYQDSVAPVACQLLRTD